MSATEGIVALARLSNKRTLEETTDESPALASHNGLLYLAWKGSGNENLKVAFSEDDGATFRTKATYSDTSDRGPAIASITGGPLAIAWKGAGNKNPNVAVVPLFSGGSGDSLADKHTFSERTEEGPCLGRFGLRAVLGWTGDFNQNLNVAHLDDLAVVHLKGTYEDKSNQTPSLALVGTELYMAWKALDPGSLLMLGRTQVGTAHDRLSPKEIVGLTPHSDNAQFTDRGPALASHNNRAVIAYKGDGNDNLNVMFANDLAIHDTEYHGNPLEDTSDRGPALAAHNGRLFMAWKGSGNENINVAVVEE